MRIDFREIEVTDIEGNKSTVDISKALGNAMYQKRQTWVNWSWLRTSIKMAR